MKIVQYLLVSLWAVACAAQCSLNNPTCFNTSLSPVPLVSPIPSWGPNPITSNDINVIANTGNLTGAGTTVTPSDFNRPIVRCTDGAFFSNALLGWVDNGQPNIFAPDDSAFIQKLNGGTRMIVAMNPVTGFCRPVSGITITNQDVLWSHTSPTTIYTLSGPSTSVISQQSITVTCSPMPVAAGTTCTGSLGTPAQLYDFSAANCIGNSFNGSPGWTQGTGSVGAFTSSADDTTFSVYYSAHNVAGQKGTWAASWKIPWGSTSPCYIYNTTNQTYQTHTGATGTVTIGPPANSGDEFYIHEEFSTLDDNWAYVSPMQQLIQGGSGSGYYIVQIDTGNIYHCCIGHSASGHLYLESDKGQKQVLFSNPTGPNTATTPGGAPCNDSHMSWNYDNLTDTLPALVTGQDHANFVPIATLQVAGSNTVCPGSTGFSGIPIYYNEIYAGNNNPSGNVLRIAHTYNSSLSWQFNAQDTVASESSSGHWAGFLSDGYCQFGSTSGSPSATISPYNCRPEILLVRLYDPSPTTATSGGNSIIK